MQDINNDEIKKMLDQLKEQAGSEDDDNDASDNSASQTTNASTRTDDEIKDMLKKHLGADATATMESSFEVSEEHVFDTVDFGTVDDEVITGEINSVNTDELPTTLEEIEENIEEIQDQTEEHSNEETVVENSDETGVETVEETVVEDSDDTGVETVEETVVEDSDDTVVETVEETVVEDSDDTLVETVDETVVENSDDTVVETVDETSVEASDDSIVTPAEETSDPEVHSDSDNINYDDVLEGQQGTVFNSFVEDFSSDLDDVVFEAEITESRAPDKQYTIFEDWEQLMKNKSYETAEDGIIPPTHEELENSMEIARKASANTDYFNPVTSNEELDAVDIALMVALGGEGELNQTVGFEKIRQVVHDVNETDKNHLKKKKIYGYVGEEYASIEQKEKINKQYKKDKMHLILQIIGTALLTIVLGAYEIAGWTAIRLPSFINPERHPDLYILAALQLLFFCFAISYRKLIEFVKKPFKAESISYISALVILALCIHHDVLILTIGYADPGMIFHSLAALLLLLDLIYDLFNLIQQKGVFDIIANEDKKLILEAYGKLRTGESDESDRGEIIDNDSYCISRVTKVKNFFSRIADSEGNATGKIISLIISSSIALCIMLVLLLMAEDFSTIVLCFVLTVAFTLVCASIFETGFAHFVSYLALKKHKTGIVGKKSVTEYGKCNIVYFDDHNVFNKKSVRTKGLKLYDNNEIYRVLYHTQAVFSKIGGPLKAVFEFATTEMVHSKNVEIKEISKEGIVAIVDNRTSVLIGTGAFMKNCGIHPKYTGADLKLEEEGEDSIMFIALNGSLGAKLYVTYQFSAEFEKLARKLVQKGVNIGIRSCDPNINNKWAKHYGGARNFRISTVRPTVKEINPADKALEGGVVSAKNVRALVEALMTCVKLDGLETLMNTARTVAMILMGVLSFALVLFSGINTVSMLALMLASALGASVMMLLTHFYLKR